MEYLALPPQTSDAAGLSSCSALSLLIDACDKLCPSPSPSPRSPRDVIVIAEGGQSDSFAKSATTPTDDVTTCPATSSDDDAKSNDVTSGAVAAVSGTRDVAKAKTRAVCNDVMKLCTSGLPRDVITQSSSSSSVLDAIRTIESRQRLTSQPEECTSGRKNENTSDSCSSLPFATASATSGCLADGSRRPTTLPVLDLRHLFRHRLREGLGRSAGDELGAHREGFQRLLNAARAAGMPCRDAARLHPDEVAHSLSSQLRHPLRTDADYRCCCPFESAAAATAAGPGSSDCLRCLQYYAQLAGRLVSASAPELRRPIPVHRERPAGLHSQPSSWMLPGLTGNPFSAALYRATVDRLAAEATLSSRCLPGLTATESLKLLDRRLGDVWPASDELKFSPNFVRTPYDVHGRPTLADLCLGVPAFDVPTAASVAPGFASTLSGGLLGNPPRRFDAALPDALSHSVCSILRRRYHPYQR